MLKVDKFSVDNDGKALIDWLNTVKFSTTDLENELTRGDVKLSKFLLDIANGDEEISEEDMDALKACGITPTKEAVYLDAPLLKFNAARFRPKPSCTKNKNGRMGFDEDLFLDFINLSQNTYPPLVTKSVLPEDITSVHRSTNTLTRVDTSVFTETGGKFIFTGKISKKNTLVFTLEGDKSHAKEVCKVLDTVPYEIKNRKEIIKEGGLKLPKSIDLTNGKQRELGDRISITLIINNGILTLESVLDLEQKDSPNKVNWELTYEKV